MLWSKPYPGTVSWNRLFILDIAFVFIVYIAGYFTIATRKWNNDSIHGRIFGDMNKVDRHEAHSMALALNLLCFLTKYVLSICASQNGNN